MRGRRERMKKGGRKEWRERRDMERERGREEKEGKRDVQSKRGKEGGGADGMKRGERALQRKCYGSGRGERDTGCLGFSA